MASSQVDLKSGWDSLWSAISGNLGGLDKVLTAVGVILVIGAVLKWLFERRKGGQGLGNSTPILWSLLVGATLASPGLLIPIFLSVLDTVANAMVSLWNSSK